MKLILGEKIISGNAKIAKNFSQRLLGLMFRKKLEKGNALIIPYCNWIHTFFMRFDIDILYLDDEYRIIDLILDLKPWRMTLPRLKAEHVVEFPKNTLSGMDIKKGAVVKCLD